MGHEPIGKALHSHSLTVGGASQASTTVMHRPHRTGGGTGLEKLKSPILRFRARIGTVSHSSLLPVTSPGNLPTPARPLPTHLLS